MKHSIFSKVVSYSKMKGSLITLVKMSTVTQQSNLQWLWCLRYLQHCI